MPVNESAEGAAVLPGAAHVAHMDTRVALQYHNITRVALRIILGEFDRNVMEGLSLSNVMEGLPLVVSLVIPLVVPLLKLSKSWHYQYWFSQFCHSGGFDNKGA